MTEDQDHLRIGTAERDGAMAMLSKHFSEGRLTHEEFSQRSLAISGAVTRGDLRRILAGLPMGYGMNLEDRLRRMDVSRAEEHANALEEAAATHDRAAVACRLLQKLAADALPILKTRNHGRALEVALKLKPQFLGRLWDFPREYRVIPGRSIWLMGDRDWGLTDSGEIVSLKTPRWSLPPRPGGFRWPDIPRAEERADRFARSRGFLRAVFAGSVEGYGQPQRSPDAPFYLDSSGVLMYGHIHASRDGDYFYSEEAEEWMAKVLR